ncbi:ABC transporter ATP-binding protein [Luethyella okanaganae]|uniref:ABC transporter ATP-binding protein n=1 Tax=Luethyella okanaganae TaxID=69372 RepID=A0ABW1VGZ7_9MICO
MIQASGVVFARRGRVVLDRVDLVAAPGTVVGIIGPNGSGKTTLLRMLFGALVPDAGTVRLDGQELGRLGRRQIARRIAVVAQDPPGDIALNVADTVMLGRLPLRPALALPARGDYAAVAIALNRVGLAGLAERPLSELSGGETQRALIARAIAQEADHVLLDEPTNHLDIRYQHEILALVRTLSATTVIVLHDLNLAARYCDRLLLLDEGRVVASGEPGDVLHPENIEAVYRVPVSRIPLANGSMHLIFSDTASTRPVDESSLLSQHSENEIGEHP